MLYKIYSLFRGIEVKKIEPLFCPQDTDNNDEIGAVIIIYLKSKSKQSVIEAIDKLKHNPCVVSAEPDYLIATHAIPNDAYFGYLWGMENIKSPLAWNYSTGSYNVTVGVVDSGIDYNHPDITDNLWIALSEQELLNSDAEQTDNSLEDNVQSILRTGMERRSRGFAAAGQSFLSDISPMDESGHGTHVAGTIGAVGNNFIGVAGVCWNIKLASLKIGNSFFNLAAAISAIDFANKNDIHVLNNSWGSSVYSSSLKFAIDNYDGLFVASAGNSASDNDNFPVYPASYNCRNIISVAAVSRDGALAPFSNFGATSIDIAAPGTDILSTDLFGGYTTMSGTSMAAPHVAGAAALLKSYRQELTHLEIKDIILSNVDRRPGLYGRILTGGTLNVYKAIEALNIRF